MRAAAGYLPSDFVGGRDPETVVRTLRGSTDEAKALLDALRDAKEVLAGRPASDLARVVGLTGERLLDPEDPLRREARRTLPRETGLSPQVCDGILDGMARDWTRARLDGLLRAEFEDPLVLDRFRPAPTGSRLRAASGGLAFHIGSGNVPGVGATSMIRSLLVKCPVLLKPGRADQTLPALLARGLAEADADLGRAVAVVYWPAGEGGAIEERLIREADRVVVYGGFDIVASVGRRLPVTTPLVAYHHRVSMGAVGRELLQSDPTADRIARAAALSAAAFDQQGCVSPRIIWVERGASIAPADWAGRLARQMESLETELPSSPVTDAEVARLQQLKGSVELREAAGGADRFFAPESGRWAVTFDTDADVSWIDCGRSVSVREIEDLERLAVELEAFRPVLQTLAIAAPAERVEALAERLADGGLTRITTFEAQPWPPPWWHHDGRGPLRALVRWVELEPR